MTIKAWLEGDQFDLQDLSELLPSGVVREGERYYLTSFKIDSPPEAGRFDIPAEQLIDRINGIASANNPSFQPVRLSGKYTDGTTDHLVVSAVTAKARARAWGTGIVCKADGTVVPNEPPSGPDYLRLSDKDPVVAEALEIMGQPLEWVDLRKVYEIVRESIKPDTVVGLGWTTNSELQSFLESAAHPAVSGRDAVHARRDRQPKHQQMLPARGRQFIGELMMKWLDRLI